MIQREEGAFLNSSVLLKNTEANFYLGITSSDR